MLLLDLKLAGLLALLFILGLVAFTWRLTRSRFASSKLSARTLRQVCEIMPFGLVVLQPDNRVAYLNPAAHTLLAGMGVSARHDINRLLGKLNLTALPQPQQRSGIINQPVFLRWWRYFLEDNSSLLVLAEGSDQQRFMRQQVFVTQLVHELRTPLTGLIAHTEIIANPLTSAAVRAASVQTVQNSAQRMARLVRDMLELYRLETSEEPERQPVNLLLVAEEAISEVYLQAEKAGLVLTLEADHPLPAVLAHSDRIKQVFLNLLDNSIKYCRSGDEITVRLERGPKGINCTVEDSGPGIAPADLPNVTERLYRARPDVEGSGLGLALVKEILRRHQAELHLQSRHLATSGGTSCRWTLALAAPPPPLPESLESTPETGGKAYL